MVVFGEASWIFSLQFQITKFYAMSFVVKKQLQDNSDALYRRETEQMKSAGIYI